jgi:ammonia channel protein AmtB
LVFLMVPAIGFLEAGLVRCRYAMGRIQVLELANANDVCLRNYFQLTAGSHCT